MDLGFEPGSDPDELGSVAHQLPQLACRRWCDPGLGQSTHPQQISQIAGVAHVVFHPSVPKPFDSQWVCQMHLRSVGLQHIDRPVPAVRCFEHHLGVGAGVLELQSQRDRVVDDPYR